MLRYCDSASNARIDGEASSTWLVAQRWCSATRHSGEQDNGRACLQKQRQEKGKLTVKQSFCIIPCYPLMHCCVTLAES